MDILLAILEILGIIIVIILAQFTMPMLFKRTYGIMHRIRLGLAWLLLLCLLSLPYDCYIIVRFVAMVVFGVMAYQYYQERSNVLMVTFGALTILFQPLIKIALERETWIVVDVVVAILLFYLHWRENKIVL